MVKPRIILYERTIKIFNRMSKQNEKNGLIMINM